MSVFETVGGSISAPTLKQSNKPTQSERLKIEYLLSSVTPSTVTPNSVQQAGQDVIAGLTQQPKSLPPKYFYDDRGSLLFEQICQLPEYYLTRTETAILQTCASAIARLTGACEIVELGSGSSSKTRILLDAYAQQQQPLSYLPIDVSGGMLESSARRLLVEYPTLAVHGLVSTYELALANLPPVSLPARMLCFVGSSLGNLTPAECDVFFQQVVMALQPGEYFLLGIDLQKPKHLLEAAYNDQQQVTAAFNLNMLRHLNWQFNGNFNLEQFEHLAFYNETLHQVEIYIKSLQHQTVALEALNLTVEFQPGETILSEISRKFDLHQLQAELKQRGLCPVQAWTDPQHWFGLLLCQLQ